jgi:hypothetical protein
VTISPSFICPSTWSCQISWACPGGQRPVSHYWAIDNYKDGLSDVNVTGIVPTTAGDGFIVYIKNWSGLENTEWHIGLVCANAS